jgi:K+-transporting ATPase ATPase A chain
MTLNGWIQILVFCGIVIALVKPLGGYMTRVFNGDRTLLSPVLGPIERGLYRLSGTSDREEQHWTTYAAALLLFNLAGFLVLYGLQRLQGACPTIPAGMAAVRLTWPSTRRPASSPTPTGRTTAAKAPCRI